MTVTTTQTLTRPAANGNAASRPEQQTVIAGTRPRPSSSAGDVVVAYLRTQQQALTAREGRCAPTSTTRFTRCGWPPAGCVPPCARSARSSRSRQRAPGRRAAMARPRPRPRARRRGAHRAPAGHLADRADRAAHRAGSGPRARSLRAPARASNAAVLEALDSPRYAALLAELDRLTHDPPRGPQAQAPARDVLPAAVRRSYRQAERRMRRARQTPAGPGTSRCTRPASRPAGPATPRRPWPPWQAIRPASSPGR